jgi:hypothetical protein
MGVSVRCGVASRLHGYRASRVKIDGATPHEESNVETKDIRDHAIGVMHAMSERRRDDQSVNQRGLPDGAIESCIQR